MGKEKKPKKGGMVLIIGMGSKPKDMKKAERRVASRGSGDAKAAEQRASQGKTHRRLKSGRLDIDEILGKRSVDPENFHGEMQRRHGMDMDEYLSHDQAPFDIQPLIDELAEKSANERGRAKSSRADQRAQNLRRGLTNPKIKGMLRNRNIDPKDWDNAVRRLDDSQLNDDTFHNLLRKLTPEMSDEERERLSSKADKIFREQGGYDSFLFDEVNESRAGEIDTDDDQLSVHDMPLNESDPSGESDEEEKLQRLLHLFEARGSKDPMDDAMRAMHAMGAQDSGVRDPYNKDAGWDRKMSLFNEASTVNTVPYGGSGQRVQNSRASGKGRNPAGPAPPGSVEAEYYGFRGASPVPPRGTEEPEEEDVDMDAAERDMFRTSFDNPNVMSAAWALLKGNPSMRDAEGRAINHPAAMVYDDLAAQIHLNEQNPFDERDGHADDESVADIIESKRRKPSERINEIGQTMPDRRKSLRQQAVRATMDDRKELDKYRRAAREQTRNTMEFGNEDESPGPNYGVQQSTGTDVRMKPGNIMDHM